MGWGSIVKSVKRAGSQVYHEYRRYSGSKAGAYLTPYLVMYTPEGRQRLRASYGNYAVAGAAMYNPAAGQIAGTALNYYDAYNAPKPRDSGFAPSVPAPEVPATPQDAADPTKMLLIGGAVVLVSILAVVVLKKSRR